MSSTQRPSAAERTLAQYDKHREDPPFCWRIGGPVTLEDGVCPECGWKHREVQPEGFFLVFKETSYTGICDLPHLQLVTNSFQKALSFLKEDKYPGHIELWEDGIESSPHRLAAMVVEKTGYTHPVITIKEKFKHLGDKV